MATKVARLVRNGRDSSNIGKGVTPWADASYEYIAAVRDVNGCRSDGGLGLRATSSYKEQTKTLLSNKNDYI